MAATRRLQKELGDLRKAASKSFRDIQVRKDSSLLFQAGLSHANLQVIMKQSMQVDESNLLVWQGLLVPDSAPYNKVPLEHVHYAL